MGRQEIKNKVLEYFKQQVAWVRSNPRSIQQFQIAQIDSTIVNYQSNAPHWEYSATKSIIREILSEFVSNGFIFWGTSDGNDGHPWFTITEYGMDVFESTSWLPYDPDGYIKALKAQVPIIDDITLAYIGEAVSAFNRNQLLSATLTLGVASENVMLLLIESYINWLSPDPARKAKLEKKVQDKFIYVQYKEFRQEFANDIKNLPKNLQADSDTYLEGIFNFIRLNRNSVGHPTGKRLDAKVVYANLQIFAEYTKYAFDLIKFFQP